MPVPENIYRKFFEQLRSLDLFTLLALPMAIYIVGFTFYPLGEAILMGFVDRYSNEFTLAN